MPGPLPDTSDTGLLKNAPAERAPEPRQKLKEGNPRALRSDHFSLPGLAGGCAAFCCSMADELSIAVLKVMAAAGVHRILAEVASLTSTPELIGDECRHASSISIVPPTIPCAATEPQ